jgi:multicomponent Na+:H+ antiporter subunit D
MFMALGGYFIAERSRISLQSMAGIGRRMPITTTGFLICGLGLIGLPLTAGFISKLYLVRALLEADMIVVLVLVLASSALSVAYLWKIVEVLWQRPDQDEDHKSSGDEQPALYIPLWILALATLWLGMAPAPFVAAAGRAAMHLVGGV